MLSFSSYRKKCIKESLHKFSARGSSAGLFEMLKIDLLETNSLPELLTENSIDKAEFNVFKKEYQLRKNFIIEEVCDYAKDSFYDELMKEADVGTVQGAPAASSGNSVSMLVNDLKTTIVQMVKELKDKISSATSIPTSPDEEEEAGMSPAPSASTPSQAPVSNKPAGATMGGGPSASPAAATSHQWPDMSGSQSQQQAPVGNSGGLNSLRPKDGWLAGAGRVLGRPFRDIGRYIKKNWFDENVQFIESMLLEQNSEIIDLIDRFQQDLLKWLDSRSQEVASDAGIPVSNPAASSDSVNAPADNGIPQDFRVVGGSAEKQASGTDPNVALGKAPQVERSAEEGNPQAQKIVNMTKHNMDTALKLLKMQHSRSRRGDIGSMKIGDLKFGDDANAIHAKDYTPEGKGGKMKPPIGKSSYNYIKEIAKKIYLTLPGADPKNANLFAHAKGGLANDPIVSIVWNHLKCTDDLQHTPYDKVAAQMLLNFGAMHNGNINASAAPTQTPEVPEDQQPAIGDRAVGGPSDQGISAPSADVAAPDQATISEPQEDPVSKSIEDKINDAASEVEKNAQQGTESAVRILKALGGTNGLRDTIKKALSKGFDPREDVWDTVKGDVRDAVLAAEAGGSPEVEKVAPEAQVNPAAAETQAAPPTPQVVPPAKVGLGDRLKSLKAKKDPAAAVTQAAPTQMDQNQEDPINMTDMDDFKHAVLGNKDVKNLQAMWLHMIRKIKSQVGEEPDDAKEADEVMQKSPEDIQTDLIKMKRHLLQQNQPVGESYKSKIDKYLKLIKENNFPVSQAAQLRERLGLPS